MSKIINIVKPIQSQQHDANGSILIHLIVGDVIKLKQDGIYITRKINLCEGYNLQSTFDGIKKENDYKD
ncbi:MAG TPA: hypothetical protein VNG53_08700 [Bacteroidia bacterium]|nr:hypothetical protein [Bacteroidia bacterium]